jgi:hypothetical protein
MELAGWLAGECERRNQVGRQRMIECEADQLSTEARMSYVYDTMRRVWDDRIAPRLDDDELAFRFGALIDAMHSANHRLDDGHQQGPGGGCGRPQARAIRGGPPCRLTGCQRPIERERLTSASMPLRFIHAAGASDEVVR